MHTIAINAIILKAPIAFIAPLFFPAIWNPDEDDPLFVGVISD
jgi:hypothetical protein